MVNEIVPVYEFLTAAENPLSYPGKLLPYSAVLVSGIVHRLAFEGGIKSAKIGTEGHFESLDSFLSMHGQASLAERFPVVQYGSGQNIKQMSNKFPVGVAPFIRGKFPDWDVAYSFMSMSGYAFTVPFHQPGTELDVMVTFLDEQQLPVVTEGEPHYFLSHVPAVTLESGETIPAYIYAGIFKHDNPPKIFKSSIFGPVAIADINASNRKLPALSQLAMLVLGIHELGLNGTFGINTPAELVSAIRGENGQKIKAYIDREIVSRGLYIPDESGRILNPVSHRVPTKTLQDLL